MIRNNICLNCHPEGCAVIVRRQIEYARRQCAAPRTAAPIRLALVIGCSTGYGLASRIAAAFGSGAVTVGVSLERPATASKPGSPGYYNNLTFDEEADKAGIVSCTLDGDAFSVAVKERTTKALFDAAARAGIKPELDLIIYSLASPVRTSPDGVTYRSVIKPIGRTFSGLSVDMMSGTLSETRVEAATPEEIAATVKVMGGEDWELWLDSLGASGFITARTRTIAYTYVGPEFSWAIYKNGTIGRAKEDLERAARAITEKHFPPSSSAPAGIAGGAWVSVQKALVTRASAVIPIIPLYVSCLYKVMKEKGLHEGCIEQIVRLFGVLENTHPPTDSEGRIRLDDWEMQGDVQAEVASRLERISMEREHFESLSSLVDLAGFRQDFLEAHGFIDMEG